MAEYDSRPDTLEHIRQVRLYLSVVITKLKQRRTDHDASKLQSPEVEGFDEFTPQLRLLTYGSPEYEAARTGLGVALEHHYAHNSHHPEHYERGICGMSLLDLVEMVCDWKAATMRHADGDIRKSVEINQERFNYTNELKHIIVNTLRELGLWEEETCKKT